MFKASIFRSQGKLIPPGSKPIDFVIPGFILVLLTFVIWNSWFTFHGLHAQDTYIAVAARQRTLMQKILREYSNEPLTVTAKDKSIWQLRQVASSLYLGGLTDSPAMEKHKIFLTGASSPEISKDLKKELALINDLVHVFSSDVREGRRLNKVTKDKVEAIFLRLTDVTDDVVREYVARSHAMTRSSLIWSLSSMILLAAFGLGLARMLIMKRYGIRQLTRAKEEAHRASQAKSIFLANMSHEIRTPLNCIIGLAEHLQSLDLQADLKRYTAMIKGSGDVLLNLINDILDLSKIESGQFQPRLEPTNFTGLIRQIGEMMEFKARQKDLEFKLQVAPDVPKFLMTDGHRLQQVLTNLVGNAIKFTEDGHVSLDVHVVRERDAKPFVHHRVKSIEFTVSDTGVGIPRDKLDYVFEKFAQAHSEVSTKYGGTGLGLAISKRIVESMDGHIKVQSELGKGSQFTFSIVAQEVTDNRLIMELEEGEETKPEIEAAAQATARLAGDSFDEPIRVLGVDDSADNLTLICVFLNDPGYVVETAGGGGEAFELFKKGRYDVILMDMRMSPVDGYSATKMIRRFELENRLTRTPIVSLTASVLESDLKLADEAGCDMHLSKPITRHALKQTVHKACKRRPPRKGRAASNIARG